MLEDLPIPLVAAAVFTAGCYLIQRLETHAEIVERALLTALATTLVFGFAATLERYIDESEPAALRAWPSVRLDDSPRRNRDALGSDLAREIYSAMD